MNQNNRTIFIGIENRIDRTYEAVNRAGLRQNVIGACFVEFARHVITHIGRVDDDFGLREPALDLMQKFDAGFAGHLEVEDDEFKGFLREKFQGGLRANGCFELMGKTVFFQELYLFLEKIAHVVNNKDFSHSPMDASGSVVMRPVKYRIFFLEFQNGAILAWFILHRLSKSKACHDKN